jgi:hypothetical protein
MEQLANYDLTIPVNIKEYMRMSQNLSIVINNMKCYEEHFMNHYDYNEAHTLRQNRQALINIHTTIVKTLNDIHDRILKEGVAKISGGN